MRNKDLKKLNQCLYERKLNNFISIEELEKTFFPNYKTVDLKRQLDIYTEAGYASRSGEKYKFLENKYPIPSFEDIIKENIIYALNDFAKKGMEIFNIKDIQRYNKPLSLASVQKISKMLGENSLISRFSKGHYSLKLFKKLKKDEKPVEGYFLHDKELHILI